MIGDVMKTTLAYLADEVQSSQLRMRAPPLNRNRVADHDHLICDYVADDVVYAVKFRRRFRMRKELFLCIVGDLSSRFGYFKLKWDARARKGFSPIQKCTTTIRQLAYGMGSDTWHEYLRMSECIIRESVYKFAKAIILVYGGRYLCKPTPNDIYRLYNAHENKHGFLGLLGSIDCMHWQWGSCPNAWRDQFTRGDQKGPTIILEAVASQDLYIWHAFFGSPGSLNDINVLDQSSIFNDIYLGKSYDVSFQANGVAYKRGYYLTDEIYPELAVFVKSYTYPNDENRLKFNVAQEAARKDVERAFGVLKRHWQILKVPARSISRGRIQSLMYCCIILHNMVLEDEGKAISPYDENEMLPTFERVAMGTPQYMENRMKVHNRVGHHDLRADLVEHIYNLRMNPVVEEFHDDLSESSDNDSEMFNLDALDSEEENDDDDEIDLDD